MRKSILALSLGVAALAATAGVKPGVEVLRDNGFQQQQLYSDMWLEDGSFFRFDNVTLGYTFDRLWNSSSRLRLTFSVSNIATITGYSGLDPELTDGLDREVYPRPRTYTLGVNLTF